ncbi:LuxR C-terminal-related transcriptional regulator [Tritonibacter mobilis]|uniref:DNA-binding response regulator n=1 Tax=Tritonibacter mobilis F1926 TaxID=1265309 RepID=A0A1B1A7P2_9RHOB|nr:response regulator transcription factor [Tritonibacter mobilis]ANP42584.1 DNA-binding response regulator [Tritonibacter mobilis F1926]KJZ21436.1 LuxR family transcriptional regulator [Tritonibacter mobilis]
MTASAPKPVRILVADDHAMVLEMFEHFLSNLPNVTAETAADLDEALAKIEQGGAFDLVLLDLNMPGMNGTSGLSKAIALNEGKPVAILTSNPSQKVVSDILSLGGAGLILKTTSLKDLGNEVNFIAAGGRYIPVDLIETQRVKTQDTTRTPLSDRETTVLNLLAEGKPNKEIGSDLNLAEPTVKMHVKSICTKLGASNRTQAVIVARDLNLI